MRYLVGHILSNLQDVLYRVYTSFIISVVEKKKKITSLKLHQSISKPCCAKKRSEEAFLK